ncbi:MAG: hypothetical protein PHU71_07340, partial [Candidatus Gracilibacteria bacterium]|nr:hypothetical protein [Candidatus Gracilibacteria bacterium]
MLAFLQVLLAILISSVLLQDFIGIFFFNLGVPKIVLQLFLALKDILLVVIIYLSLVANVILKKRIRLTSTGFFLIFYAIIIFVYYTVFYKSRSLMDLRALIFPVLAYLAGFLVIIVQKKTILTWIEKIGAFSVILSLLFYFSGPSFFIKMRTLAFTEYIRGFYGLVNRGLPSTFFSKFGGVQIFRLAGPILNPIGTSLLFIFIFSLIYGYYRYQQWSLMNRCSKTLLVLTLCAILLTLSRGPIIGFFLGYFILEKFIMPTKRMNKWVIIVGFIFVALSFTTFKNMVMDTIE